MHLNVEYETTYTPIKILDCIPAVALRLQFAKPCFWEVTIIPHHLYHLLHTWMQPALVHTECHSLTKPAEPSHLHIADEWFCDDLTGCSSLPQCVLRFCPWKLQAWWWKGTTGNIFQFQPRIQTQLSLWLYKGNIARSSGTWILS